jgi:hypothetical protein
MSIRLIKVNGRKVWQACVAYRGHRKSAIRDSKPGVRAAEADLLKTLQAELAQTEAQGAVPATLKALLEAYAEEMEHRGKGEASVARVEYTALAVERLYPDLLDKPVSLISDTDVFAFRNARLREGKTVVEHVDGKRVTRRAPAKASTINRDLRTLHAALKLARPDDRFPGGAFFKEDETRVRWLRRRNCSFSTRCRPHSARSQS